MPEAAQGTGEEGYVVETGEAAGEPTLLVLSGCSWSQSPRAKEWGTTPAALNQSGELCRWSWTQAPQRQLLLSFLAKSHCFCLSGCFFITLLIIFKSDEYMSQSLGLSVDL